jgi:hypothetical protein
VEGMKEIEKELHGNHIMQFSTQAPGNFQHERARQASERKWERERKNFPTISSKSEEKRSTKRSWLENIIL